MQFKPELAEKILTGEKWQTRRLVKPSDKLGSTLEIGDTVYRNGRLHWRVGDTYAVQPGRGKPAIARIKILRIRREDVRDISFEDAIAEGFSNALNFLRVWCSFYAPKGIDFIKMPVNEGVDYINDCPDPLYDAWVFDFCLVENHSR